MRAWGDLFEDLAHQLEALRLDALGQADQALPRNNSACGASTLRNALDGRATNTSSLACKGGQQVIDRFHPVVQANALEVARVFTIDTHGLGLGRVAHPLAHRHTVFRQQVRHGGAEAAAAQNCNRLLFSHIQSVKSHKVATGAL